MNDHDAQEEGELETPRRPYVKPEIITEEAFETMALSCNRADFTCQPGPINS